MAIEATKHRPLPDRALRWCGRAGFELRVFCAKNKRSKFVEAVKHANYHWYLALKEDIVISRTDAMSYAKQHDFDLVVFIPESLRAWRKNSALKEWELKPMSKTIGSARSEFGRKPDLKVKRFTNGAVMRRVV